MKKHFIFWKKLIFVTGLIRFFVGFLIFNFPIIAVMISLLADGFDSVIAYKAGWKWDSYTRYDKSLDFWWYIFVLIYSISLPIYPILLILFIIRSIGQLIAIITAKHEILFWFPNLFERYFILYLLAQVFLPKYLFYFYDLRFIFYPLFITALVTIPNEYILHVKGWFYSEGRWPRSIKKSFRK